MKRIGEEIKKLGWSDGLLHIAARALEKATSGYVRLVKYYFVAQPVPPTVPGPAAVASNISTYQVEPNDPLVARFPRPQHVLRKRFSDGAVCFAAVRNEALLGFIWIQLHQYEEDEVRCLYVLEQSSRAAWDFDVWVDPQFRLTRTFARLWDVANAFLREHGCRWSISRISAFNPASLAAHRRLGLRYLQSGLFVLVGSLQLAFFTCAPFIHFSLSSRHRPVLRLGVSDSRGKNAKAAATTPDPLT